jgi:phosphoglycolate phosphatase-like HAD superfamily hydrolase
MIKLICFDLDGNLADLKEVHYESLNRALKEAGSPYIITREHHVKIFDGLSTKKKLEI